MALYDNPHWMLVYIKDSFMYSDKTGKAESVMIKDDFPKILQSKGMEPLPEAVDSDEEDFEAVIGSSDIEIDKEYGHRHRTSTAQRLERLDMERNKASKIKHIKWEYNPNNISAEEQKELFKKKDLQMIKLEDIASKRSLLSEQLERSKTTPLNPFMAYAKYDGDIHIGVPVKKIKIFMCMLPTDQRSYPLHVAVTTNATVEEFIGLIFYRYFNVHSEMKFQQDLSKYGLYMAEDDGEVDRDFPCLDPKEMMAKFDFATLGLVELQPNEKERHDTIKTLTTRKNELEKIDKLQEVASDLAKMAVHTNAMEAPFYQSYRVCIINKVRTKTEVQLGISGEKIEIDPVITSKGASRFWHRQRAVTHNMNNVAFSGVIDFKGSKSIFTLIISHCDPHISRALEGLNVSISGTRSLRRSASFKSYEFEAESAVANEIVTKINSILEMTSSATVKEYQNYKDRKARRKSFHTHR
ncbi:target of rapamycin complex 2 subunit MAPKAP1 isoform X2 [Copidosoma floridanum]|uniref:target of rapamycin complex 2 subunit MAPKAP1 isoform X2 n=1 Tax=Copidosoma floridanum TaxID=29053 RepID=UPI000C6F9D02|nr:target of rapamycin complex 2 subunit MAPKAP1 isoform X2 [Copidosoma floridanum]